MLQLTFHGLRPSEAVSQYVERQAQHLQHLAPKIQKIRTVVELPHQRHRRGNHFRVLLDVTLPHREFVIGRDPASRVDDEDIYVAIHRAFEAASRQLTNRRRRTGRERSATSGSS